MRKNVVVAGWLPLLLAGMLVFGAAGCAKDDEPVVTEFTPGDGSDASDMDTDGEGLPNIDQEGLLFSPDRGLQTVYFAFDSSSLRPDALAALSRNADLIKQTPGVIIQLAGHCDERGTQEYNLALGERRALAVREHLINLGVSGSRMVTISYGEEQPAQLGSNESAWSLNRRVEFNRASAI